MRGPRITRRNALALGVGGGVVATGALVSRRWLAPDTAPAEPELHTALESVLSDPEATRRLGDAFLHEKPEEASVDHLLRALPLPGVSPGERKRIALADPASVLASVGAATASEFARGGTVVVDGWMLARSEARLAGLYAAVSA